MEQQQQCQQTNVPAKIVFHPPCFQPKVLHMKEVDAGYTC